MYLTGHHKPFLLELEPLMVAELISSISIGSLFPFVDVFIGEGVDSDDTDVDVEDTYKFKRQAKTYYLVLRTLINNLYCKLNYI